MSKTPETDGLTLPAIDVVKISGKYFPVVAADHARSLELDRNRLRDENQRLREALEDLCKCLAPTNAHIASIGKHFGPSLQGKLIHARAALKG